MAEADVYWFKLRFLGRLQLVSISHASSTPLASVNQTSAHDSPLPQRNLGLSINAVEHRPSAHATTLKCHSRQQRADTTLPQCLCWLARDDAASCTRRTLHLSTIRQRCVREGYRSWCGVTLVSDYYARPAFKPIGHTDDLKVTGDTYIHDVEVAERVHSYVSTWDLTEDSRKTYLRLTLGSA